MSDSVSYTVDTRVDGKVAKLRDFVIGGKNIHGQVDVYQNGNVSLFFGFASFTALQLESISGLVNAADECFVQHDDNDV